MDFVACIANMVIDLSDSDFQDLFLSLANLRLCLPACWLVCLPRLHYSHLSKSHKCTLPIQ